MVAGAHPDLARKIREAVAALDEGVVVEHVATGAEAVERLSAGHAGVLVLDSRLDDVPAPAVFVHARRLRPDVRGFLVLDHPDDELSASVRSLGFRDCLPLDVVYGADFARRLVFGNAAPTASRSNGSIAQRMACVSVAPVALVDGTGCIVYANDAFRTLGGLWNQDPAGAPIAGFFPELPHAFAPSEFRECVLRFRRPSGNESPHRARLDVVRDGRTEWAISIDI